MPRLRHFAVALMGVLVLQVSLLGSRVVCSRAPSSAVATAHEAAGHDGGHDHAAPAPGDRADERSSDRAPAHCLTTMSCAVTGLAGCGVSPCDEAITPASVIAMVDDALPASLGGAPEPPPPRG